MRRDYGTARRYIRRTRWTGRAGLEWTSIRSQLYHNCVLVIVSFSSNPGNLYDKPSRLVIKLSRHRYVPLSSDPPSLPEARAVWRAVGSCTGRGCVGGERRKYRYVPYVCIDRMDVWMYVCTTYVCTYIYPSIGGFSHCCRLALEKVWRIHLRA